MGLEKDGYEFTPAQFIDDGEDALLINFTDTGETVKYVPERTCAVTATAYGNGRCSSCGEELTQYEGFDPFEMKYTGKYCIECGAKVVE